MQEAVKDAVLDGGEWSAGLVDTPGLSEIERVDAPQEPVGPEYKIIIPNAPPRVDAPAPGQSPWRGVALLNFFKGGNLVTVGTGFLCQPDVIVTAAHNLKDHAYDAAGAWLGYDGLHNPAVPATRILAFATHKTLDAAVFVVEGRHAGAFDLGGALPPAHGGVTLAGYAMPYQNGAARLSYALGPVTSVAPERLAYAISTQEGDSGAPVFSGPAGSPAAVAIHTGSLPGLATSNIGLHLSPPVVQDIYKLIAFARASIGEK